jgi:beta-glucanase (GH16 family)
MSVKQGLGLGCRAQRSLLRSATWFRAASVFVCAIAVSFLVAAVVNPRGVADGQQLAVQQGSAVIRPRQKGPTDPSSTHKWHLLFSDNFNGSAGSLPSSQNWRVITGSDWDSEVQDYVDLRSSLQLSGTGYLKITAHKVDGSWQSGRIQSNRSFYAPRGTSILVESRIELPDGGQGIWPAFWAVGDTFDHVALPGSSAGEVDLAETINNDDWVAQVFHCGPPINGPCNTHGIQHTHYFPTAAGAAGWNTYGLLWNNEASTPYIEFLIDGVMQFEVTETQVGAYYWNLAFDHPYFFIYNIAVGGSWPGPPNQITNSCHMLVDFFRVYRSG